MNFGKIGEELDLVYYKVIIFIYFFLFQFL